MDFQRFAKVLALAASDNDAEALHALRTAHRLLAESGSDFVALAARLGGTAPSAALEDTVFHLRNEVRDLRAENERLKQARTADGTPTSMFGAAQAASDVIRLRAELAAAQDALAAQAHLRITLQEVQAELSLAIARLSDAEMRRLRLEAENRRLSAEREQALPGEEIRVERKPRGVRAKTALNQYALF